MEPFQRFSEPAKRVLTAAQEEAERDGHGEIRPEHLLIGVIAQPLALGARALRTLGVDVPALLGKLWRPPSGVVAADTLPTAATKRVIEGAVAEADRLGHRLVGTEHLLVGLTTEESAARVELLECGLTLDGLRETLERMWAERQPEPQTEPTPTRSLPPPSVIVGSLLERARTLAATDNAPVAETEHLVLALAEPGSGVAELLAAFGLAVGPLRERLRWAPEVRSAATALARSRASKEDAIRSQDYSAAAHAREAEKVLRERYQLVRTTWWVGLVER
jgi:ATP-dependent Clp protease ATP-binding subunit ClpA